jgi:hypothetical protein
MICIEKGNHNQARFLKENNHKELLQALGSIPKNFRDRNNTKEVFSLFLIFLKIGKKL